MDNHQHLLENPELLLKHYLATQKEIEEANQLVYDYKRQLQTLEALKREYESEIETINAENKATNKSIESKLLQAKEEFSNIRDSLNERIQSLQNELEQKDIENEEILAHLEIAKKNVSVPQAFEDNKQVDEIIQLQEEKECLLQSLETLKQSLQEYEIRNNTQVNKLQQLESEYQEIKEALSVKKNEVSESSELIQTLQDEIMCLKTELETLKSQPLEEQSKGNSLFAEVDDRRVQLQSTVNSMRTKYYEMKRERADHLKLIAHLRNENAVLCERWETEINQIYNDEAMVNDSCKRRIKVLEELVEKYKKDLNEKNMEFSGSSSDEMKFFDNMLKIKKKEIEELREKIAALSLSERLLTRELAETRKDVRKWKLDATQYKNEINNLKFELDESKSENKKISRENEFQGVEPFVEDRRSHITTRKKSGLDNQTCVKSCLKTKSDDQFGVERNSVICKEQVDKETHMSQEKSKTTVDALLQFDLSPSYVKQNNITVLKEKSDKLSNDTNDHQAKKVHFTEDTVESVKTKKTIRSYQIGTKCSATYVDNQDNVSDKENIQNPL